MLNILFYLSLLLHLYYWGTTGVLLGCYWGNTGVLLGYYWATTGGLLEYYWGTTQTRISFFQLGGVARSCHPSGGWLVECRQLYYVLLSALIACPNQVGTRQGQRSRSCDVLVGYYWGTSGLLLGCYWGTTWGLWGPTGVLLDPTRRSTFLPPAGEAPCSSGRRSKGGWQWD